MNQEKRVQFSAWYHNKKSSERMKLQDEMVQTVIYNLMLVEGPKRMEDILYYFGVRGGDKASQRLKANLNKLTDENWEAEPLLLRPTRWRGTYEVNDILIEFHIFISYPTYNEQK
jgi:hypothetical protein